MSEEIKKILAQLEDHEARLNVLEDGGKVVKKSIIKMAHSPKTKKGEDLSAPIHQLLQKSFFNEAKVDLDVVSALQKKLLTKKKPLRASVVNVLRSMVREGSLERVDTVIDGKERIAYKTI